MTGFAYIAKRLNRIDQRLNSLEKQTRAIRKFLDSAQHAQLSNAVDNLKLAQSASDPETRRHLLVQCKQAFGILAHQYKSMLEDPKEGVELWAGEDCYVLAAIGSVTRTSDLGMFDEARDEMSRHLADWQDIARKHCGTLVLKDNPERLLGTSYLKTLSTANLVCMLDFTNKTHRGIAWIDDLREGLGSTALLGRPWNKTDLTHIEYANKLLAKNDTLDGFAAHMNFLADKKISLSHFASHAQELQRASNADYLVLTARG